MDNVAKEEEKRRKRRAYMREYNREWRKNNPELLAYRRKWASDWWKKNPEKGREKSRNNYLKHREQRLEYVRKYRKERKEQIRESERKRMLDNPQRRIGVRLRIRILSALSQRGLRKTTGFEELVGATIPTMKSHLEMQFQEGMTWENHSMKGWHIDHIIPLASFDLTNVEEQKKAFHYTNLQPLWALDNIRKGAKNPN